MQSQDIDIDAKFFKSDFFIGVVSNGVIDFTKSHYYDIIDAYEVSGCP